MQKPRGLDKRENLGMQKPRGPDNNQQNEENSGYAKTQAPWQSLLLRLRVWGGLGVPFPSVSRVYYDKEGCVLGSLYGQSYHICGHVHMSYSLNSFKGACIGEYHRGQ